MQYVLARLVDAQGIAVIVRTDGVSLMSEATDSTTVKAGAPPLADRPRKKGPKGASGIAVTIGHALQAHYDDLIAAPMPDRFLVLLAELEARENARG